MIEKIKSADTTDTENNQYEGEFQTEESQGCGTKDELDQMKISEVKWSPQQK